MTPLAALLAAAVAAAEPSRVDADHFVAENGTVTATGNVRFRLGDDTVRAATARLDGSTAVVDDGSLERPDVGTVTFERLTLDLDTGTGRLEGATLITTDGEARVSGEVLELHADGTLVGERVTLTTCVCDGPEPWAVSARRATIKDETLSFSGASVDAFGVPLLPVPFGSVPLSRRSGILPPTLGAGDDGILVHQPVYLTMGPHADLTVGPEVRTARSVRVLSETRYALRDGAGTLSAWAGYDGQTESARGAGRLDHTWDAGRVVTAVDADAVSDLEVFSDYGDRFLYRGQPWAEARALIGTGPLELTTDTFQAPDPSDQEVIALATRVPREAIGGGVFVDGEAATSLRGQGSDLSKMFAAAATARARVRASRPTTLGPLRIEPAASLGGDGGGAFGQLTRAPAGWAQGSALLGLPMWRMPDAGFERWEPAVSVSAAQATGPGDTVPPAWAVAPRSTWRRTAGDTLTEVVLATVTTPDGSTASTDAHLESGPFKTTVQAATLPLTGVPTALDEVVAIASTSVGWDRPRLSATTGWLYADPTTVRQPDPDALHMLHQLRGNLRVNPAIALSTLTATAGAAFDLESGAFISERFGLSYRHPTGCLTVGAVASIDDDRTLPDVQLTLTVDDG